MPSPPYLTALRLAAITGTTLAISQFHILPYPRKATTTIPDSLQQSPRYRRQINPFPKQSQAVDSTHSITIPRPRDPRTGQYISDAEVLRRFTLGLWSGWAFTAERLMLVWVAPKRLQVKLGTEIEGPRNDEKELSVEEATTGAHLRSLTDLRRAMPVPVAFSEWSEPSETTSATSLPKPGTILFGAFKVADVHIATTQQQQQPPGLSSSSSSVPGSYIDFIYGAHTSWIRGMHRFEVVPSSRPDSSSSSETAATEAESVTIRFSSSSLKPPPIPTSGKEATIAAVEQPLILGGRSFGPFLAYFHNIYAGYLFADGMREVLRG
ncbi:uncharacterized protein AB675_6246 [Cyphellophora attinorum]|uniref:Uncharacterized protein n=1 Tax=Cyphellophora attinorum TaxID=1664694 RepID=A0A0N1HVI3_9EURO|nr:uncharacterized protein AB675_6246 [Phialophora attinorum]KPI43814.1 hypothetical protein AB675_6246 [Phialophora attinorum]